MRGAMLDQEQFRAMLAKRKGARTLREFADEIGVTFQFLADVLAGKCGPGHRIASALDYEQIVMYRRAPRKRA